MAKKSGFATPGGKGGTSGGGKPAPDETAAKAAKQPAAGAKLSPPSQAGRDFAKPATPAGGRAPAAFAAAAPGTPGGSPDDAASDDGPCFEFRTVLDENGKPVLRKFQVPCPEE